MFLPYFKFDNTSIHSNIKAYNRILVILNERIPFVVWVWVSEKKSNALTSS